MNFNEWFDSDDVYGEDYCDGFDVDDLRKAWNAAIKESVRTIEEDVKVIPEIDKPFTVIQMCMDKINILKDK